MHRYQYLISSVWMCEILTQYICNRWWLSYPKVVHRCRNQWKLIWFVCEIHTDYFLWKVRRCNHVQETDILLVQLLWYPLSVSLSLFIPTNLHVLCFQSQHCLLTEAPSNSNLHDKICLQFSCQSLLVFWDVDINPVCSHCFLLPLPV